MVALKQRCLRWTAGFWRWLSAWRRREPEGGPPPVVPPLESRMTIAIVVRETMPPGAARLAVLLDPRAHDAGVRPPRGLAADRP